MAIEKNPIVEGLKIASNSFARRNIIAEMDLERVPEEKENDPVQLVWVNGFLKFKEAEFKKLFFVPVPLPNHRDSKDWAWLVVYEFSGSIFGQIRDKSLEDALEFLKVSMDIVDELIHVS